MTTIEQVWNFINGIKFGYWIAILTGLFGLIKKIEDVREKKDGFANKAWRGFKRYFTAPTILLNEVQILKKEVAHIKEEVTYNGGLKLRDALKECNDSSKLSSNALKEIVLKMRVAENLDSVMKFELDVEGNLSKPNKALLNKFGYSEKDIGGKSWENYFNKEDIPSISQKLHRAFKYHADFHSEHEVEAFNGDKYMCKINGIALKDGVLFLGFMGTVEIINN